VVAGATPPWVLQIGELPATLRTALDAAEADTLAELGDARLPELPAPKEKVLLTNQGNVRIRMGAHGNLDDPHNTFQWVMERWAALPMRRVKRFELVVRRLLAEAMVSVRCLLSPEDEGNLRASNDESIYRVLYEYGFRPAAEARERLASDEGDGDEEALVRAGLAACVLEDGSNLWTDHLQQVVHLREIYLRVKDVVLNFFCTAAQACINDRTFTWVPVDENRIYKYLRNPEMSFGTLYPFAPPANNNRVYGSSVNMRMTVRSREAAGFTGEKTPPASIILVAAPGDGKSRMLGDATKFVDESEILEMNNISGKGASGVSHVHTGKLVVFAEDSTAGLGGGDGGGGDGGGHKGGGGNDDAEAARTEAYNDLLKIMNGETLTRQTMKMLEDGLRGTVVLNNSFVSSAMIAAGNFQEKDPTTSAMGNRRDILYLLRFANAANPISNSLGGRSGTSLPYGGAMARANGYG
jgi:hypothetical protein